MTRQVFEKMGITDHERIIFLRAPYDAVSVINAPAHIEDSLIGKFDHIFFFTKTQMNMQEQFASLKPHVASTGKLWVCWPKSKQLGSDLNVPNVIRIGYDNGLVESTNLSINEVWTALKFTWPKPGKVYNNSYGVLSITD